VPYAITAPGIKAGIWINVFAIFLMLIATHLYLTVKDKLGYDSISELSYLCFGRYSVYMINLLISFVIMGVLILYMILFSKIVISIYYNFKPSTDVNN
jgi:amino acid permease